MIGVIHIESIIERGKCVYYPEVHCCIYEAAGTRVSASASASGTQIIRRPPPLHQAFICILPKRFSRSNYSRIPLFAVREGILGSTSIRPILFPTTPQHSISRTSADLPFMLFRQNLIALLDYHERTPKPFTSSALQWQRQQ